MKNFRNLMLVAASAMVIANVAPVSAAQDLASLRNLSAKMSAK